MARKFRHFTWTDRLIIEKLYNSGISQREIARRLGFSSSSMSVEVRRGLYDHLNGDTWETEGRYSAQIAQDISDWNATAKGCPIKLEKNHEYAQTIANRIKGGESPDAIVGDMKNKGLWTVSTTTLYNYIDAGYIPGITNKDLSEKPKRKRKYSKVKQAKRPPKGPSIERRPDEINTRSTFGHWEMDSVIGQSKGKEQSLLVLTERKTRQEIIFKVSDKTSSSVVSALSKIVPQYPEGTFKTVTVDNGSEFSDYDGIKQYFSECYYCHPFTSSERGSNERQNRIIRRFFPKGHSLAGVNQSSCELVSTFINNMHRKILDYRSSQELFTKSLEELPVNTLTVGDVNKTPIVGL